MLEEVRAGDPISILVSMVGQILIDAMLFSIFPCGVSSPSLQNHPYSSYQPFQMIAFDILQNKQVVFRLSMGVEKHLQILSKRCIKKTGPPLGGLSTSGDEEEHVRNNSPNMCWV